MAGRNILLAGVALPTLATTALASNVPPLEEVIVTAQRRDQALMDIPMSVSVLDRAQLQASRIRNIDNMVPYTPGLSGIEQGVSTPIFAIRGISSNSFGIGGEASVGIFIDDAYIGRINSTGAAFMDVARVEVLKGPQGTLFGRNSSAGAINIVTVQPQDTAAIDYRFGYGSFNSVDGEFTLNAPLVADTLLFRGTVLRHSDDGYEENVWLDRPVGDRDTWAGRGALLWRMTDSLDGTLTLSAENTTTGGLGYGTRDPALAAAGGVSPDPFDGKMASDVEIFDNNRSRDARLHINWDINPQLAFKSISAWHYNSSPNLFDVDGSAVFIFNAGFTERESRTGSQEFRLLGQAGKLDWMTGASAFVEDVSADILLNYNELNTIGGTIPGVCNPSPSPCSDNVVERSETRGNYRSYAAYADLSFQWTDNLTLGGGLRYTLDQKDYSYNAPAVDALTTRFLGNNVLGYATDGEQELADSWSQWQPRLVLDYRWSDRLMTYGSISRGYKSGGFDPSTTPELSSYDEETSWSYEVGLKSEAWERRLAFTATAYLYDYENYQVQLINAGLARTVNAPEVNGHGLELELNLRPHPRWLLIGSAAFARSRFGEFQQEGVDLDGNRTILSPETTASLVADYRQPLGRTLFASMRAEWLYESKQYFSVQNLESEKQDPYAVTNLYLGIGANDGRWQLRLVGKNLFDTEYFVLNRDMGAGPVAYRAAPRFIGLEISGAFGRSD